MAYGQNDTLIGQVQSSKITKETFEYEFTITSDVKYIKADIVIGIEGYFNYPFIESVTNFITTADASKVGIKVYENGFLLKEKKGLKLIAVNDIDSDGNFKYRLMCNYPIVPSAFFEDIKNFINFMIEVYKRQEKSAKQVSDDALGLSFGSFNINCLVYGKTYDDNNFNIYNLDISKNISDVSYLDKVSDSDYSSVDEVIRLSSNIKKEKVKVKINE